MSRLPIPANVESAPPASHALLAAVQKQLGLVPNLFRMVSTSPAALEGYLGLMGALAKGALPAPTRERIALAVAEINGCSYCLSAHTYLGKHVAHLDDAEMAANRDGHSTDAHADKAVRFAAQVTRTRGQIAPEDIRALKASGYDDPQLIEIVLHVALNVWTNYINLIADTEVDFPVVAASGRRVAAI